MTENQVNASLGKTEEEPVAVRGVKGTLKKR